MLADDSSEYPELQADTPSHVDRLDRLVADQAAELATLHAVLREVTALCDLAEWAADSLTDGRPAAVRVDELRRVLTPPRSSDA
ncbi:MAG: hypothetical protein JO144_03755 [Actinobacteria bacterium]|nr:hypothetical protein [Actinomycetota bacterium]